MALGIGVVPKQMKGKPGVTGDLAFLRRLLPSETEALSKTLDPVGTMAHMSVSSLPLNLFSFEQSDYLPYLEAKLGLGFPFLKAYTKSNVYFHFAYRLN